MQHANVDHWPNLVHNATSNVPVTDTTPEYSVSDMSVVMGTYNEEEAVETVLTDIEQVTNGEAEIVCIDGSSDNTPEIARANGARVIDQEPQGYGIAVHEAIQTSSGEVVVTTDCDDTYPMEYLPVFLETINAGYDVVSGDRLYYGADAMPLFNRLGNRMFALLASGLMGSRVHDTTTGMRAYRREVVDSIEWTQNTGLSAELLVRPVMRGYSVREIPIPYRDRAGESKLDPFQGGLEIGGSILKVCLEERIRSVFG